MRLRYSFAAFAALLLSPTIAQAQGFQCSPAQFSIPNHPCWVISRSGNAICEELVDGKIPWNTRGSTDYKKSELEYICKNTLDAVERTKCYSEYVSNGAVWHEAALTCRGERQGATIHAASTGPRPHNFQTRAPSRSTDSRQNTICTTNEASIGDSFETNFLLRANGQAASIAPGMVFHLKDLENGDVTGLGGGVQARKPVPIFASFYNSPNVTTEAMLEPGANSGLTQTVDGDRLLSNMNTALRQMMGARPSVRVLGSSYQVEEVFSSQHISLALKGSFHNSSVDVKGSFDFDSKGESSKILGQFVNSYYGVHVDYTGIGQGTKAFFTPEAVPLIEKQIDDRGALVFVDSVIYGRAAYFSAEAEKNETEMKNMLKGAYERAGTKVTGEEEGELNKLMRSSNLKAVFMGDFGNSGRTPRTIEQFEDILNADRSSNDLGVPVAYTLRFVDDHRQAATHIMTEVTDRTCRPLRSKVSFDLDKIEVILSSDEGGADTEIRGGGTVYVEYDDPSTGKVVKLDPIGAATSALLPGFDKDLIRLQEQAGVDVRHFFFPIENIRLAENLPEHYPPTAPIFVDIGQSYEFEIPDAPETPDVNEVKTARIIVKWGEIIEDDGDKFANADDRMEGKSPSDISRRFTVTQYEGMSASRKTFHFRGDPEKDYVDAEFKIHFSLDTLD